MRERSRPDEHGDETDPDDAAVLRGEARPAPRYPPALPARRLLRDVLRRRRGRIEGMEARGNAQVVRGFVPLANMFGYVNDLRSQTQGRATYSMEFHHYEPIPRNLQEELVEKARS